jgi:hypothetical protein
MFGQYDHRWAIYEQGHTRYISTSDKAKPNVLPIPQYWIHEEEVRTRFGDWDKEWQLVYRRIARATDERTAILTIIPFGATSTTVIRGIGITEAIFLLANTNSLIFDYLTRQKVAGTDLLIWIFNQLPVVPPHTYTPALLDFIVPRVLELTYTAWDLQPFAQDVGWDGPPFIWDEERRFLVRCELDALYFHLYGIRRDDADYILETFPIVRRKDEAAWGSYRTKDTILAMYDQMAALPTMLVPHPKSLSQVERDLQDPGSSPLRPLGEGGQGDEGLYAVPDVRQWTTWLTPGPADASVAHT